LFERLGFNVLADLFGVFLDIDLDSSANSTFFFGVLLYLVGVPYKSRFTLYFNGDELSTSLYDLSNA
jgi:hypothetical protein